MNSNSFCELAMTVPKCAFVSFMSCQLGQAKLGLAGGFSAIVGDDLAHNALLLASHSDALHHAVAGETGSPFGDGLVLAEERDRPTVLVGAVIIGC